MLLKDSTFIKVNSKATVFSNHLTLLQSEIGASNNSCDAIYAGPHPFSEGEMKVVRDQINRLKNNIKVYITFHSYGQKWMYPWGYTADLPHDWKDLVSVFFSFFVYVAIFFFYTFLDLSLFAKFFTTVSSFFLCPHSSSFSYHLSSTCSNTLSDLYGILYLLIFSLYHSLFLFLPRRTALLVKQCVPSRLFTAPLTKLALPPTSFVSKFSLLLKNFFFLWNSWSTL